MAAGFRKHNGGDTVRFGFYWKRQGGPAARFRS